MEEMEEQFGPRLKIDDDTVYEQMIEGMDPFEHVCRRLEATVDEAGWDQPPHFYNLTLLGNLPGIELDQLKAAEGPLVGGVAVSEIRLPEPCYMDPATGLMMLLEYLSEMSNASDVRERKDLLKILNRLVPVGFFGFGVVSEGWTLPRTIPVEERKRISDAHMMHEHPDRVELRVLTAATADGRISSVTRIRGEIPDYTEYDEKTSLNGRVPDVVRLCTSLFDNFNKWRQKRVEEFDAKDAN